MLSRIRGLVPPPGDRWLAAWALGSVATGAASLLVPLYVVALGAGPLALGGLAAAAAFAGVPGALVVGRLADRSGRHRAYVVGALAVVAVALFALPFVESVALVVAIRGTTGEAVTGDLGESPGD